jgi:hypothetical protein
MAPPLMSLVKATTAVLIQETIRRDFISATNHADFDVETQRPLRLMVETANELTTHNHRRNQ